MNRILITFYLSRIAYAFFRRLSNEEDLNLYLELFADAVFITGYREFSSGQIKISNHEKNKMIFCQTKVRPDALKILRRFERLGYCRSWVFEETLYYAKKQGLL